MKQISFTFLPSQAERLLLGLFGCPYVLQPGPSRAGPERLVASLILRSSEVEVAIVPAL